MAGFVALALAIGGLSGRFGQRVFDDEVLSLVAIDGRSYLDLFRFYLGGNDVHPPLPFLWLRALHDLDLPVWLQRALSLACAAAGFALVLDLVWRRLPEVATASRVLAVALFLGAPLLYGMGASLRWYSLLTLPVALALWSVLTAGRPTLLAGVSLGLAANISFLASIPALAYLLWRYLVQRRFDVAQDGAFLAVMTIVALPGLFAFLNSAANLTAQIDSGIIAAMGSTGLGIIGGYGLGLTHSVIAIPFILLLLVAVAAALLALRRPARSDLLVVSLLISLFCLVLTMAGFAKPRSFLFALPFMLAVIVLGSATLSWRRWHGMATAVASLVVTVASLWLLNTSDRPFKRNLHIPDADVLAAVRAHAPRETSFIVSSEPGLGWQLRKEGYCVVAPSLPNSCDNRTAPVIVTIDDGTFTQRRGFAFVATSALTVNYGLAHQQVFGDDEDGPTKTFLAGQLVPKFLVGIAVYKRD